VIPKDGKCVCLECGRRVDGLFKAQGHASGCPVGMSMASEKVKK
jgi:hypothetical protein